MRYKAILMDADQTLLDFETAEDKALRLLFQSLGIETEAAGQDYRRINNACWAAFERGEMTQDELRRRRFIEFTNIYVPGGDAGEIGAYYERLLSRQSDILPHADEAARAISKKLPIAIVTNGIASIQRPRLQNSAVWPYVSALVISEEVGARKPEPDMIHRALAELGLANPGDALMIGDSMTSDMPAARDAGMDFLWYNPHGKARPDGACVTWEARDVREFIPIATMEREET